MIGTVERKISHGVIKDEKCKVCNENADLLVDVYIKILAIRIFVFPLEKRTSVSCAKCKKANLKSYELSSTAKNKLFKIDEETKTPVKFYSGYIVITILLFLWMFSKLK
ncbi:hypothetical protein FIA58_011055 [Flavobacterium jejuense]|uniref:Zinc-ribbon 15 domain-containing protein n=1 Tax=Flavobacterium jejuense TaxID=1544455 RepID=A0ABX0IVV9_9FLAO|nr:hypothetical protein [Flavobacterium jejuense]NHN26216.1 hypothetical protein [Flavobacterium jejuense]